MRKTLTAIGLLALAGGGTAWWLTAPTYLPEDAMAGLEPDAAAGESVFYAGGCASCHAAPGASGEEMLVLAGGRALESDFGTFHAPNISSDSSAGIGGWSSLDLANAMQNGVSPQGRHYYPAFPFTTYTRADLQDIADLHAFLQGLPADPTPSKAHDVGFPFDIRRLLGGWDLLYLDRDWIMEDPGSDEVARGRYLVEALGHCGECHTPRNALGGPDTSRWLGGAENPSGAGHIPNITSGELDWSAGDIAEYLSSGLTPDFDVAGGEMADVVTNLSHLPRADLEAIGAYVKAVAPVESE
ncbi:c-type cytochrome [Pseudooceanicola algae]|uniref:Nicotinate dehydrogenase subunit B n=1 Tax=Pseudooceanicola algae TaxID=1537215 RepID=A0A418SEN2_9RHOB|nr:cytochrome c [Pseudooceanicola algae]QPM89778.1 Nicotinate dehydrogenase subunit B [Pseudooceanicola algae]